MQESAMARRMRHRTFWRHAIHVYGNVCSVVLGRIKRGTVSSTHFRSPVVLAAFLDFNGARLNANWLYLSDQQRVTGIYKRQRLQGICRGTPTRWLERLAHVRDFTRNSRSAASVSHAHDHKVVNLLRRDTMSALGQNGHFAVAIGMSVLPPKVDIQERAVRSAYFTGLVPCAGRYAQKPLPHRIFIDAAYDVSSSNRTLIIQRITLE